MTRYKAIKVNGKKRDYHRWLMEQKLGRPLRRDEVVHHINEDPRDNDVNNLCLLSNSEHTRHHQLGKKASPETLAKMSKAQLGNSYGPPRKLTDEQVLYIRENYKPYDPELGARALSKRFGIDHSTISRIASGQAYRGAKTHD